MFPPHFILWLVLNMLQFREHFYKRLPLYKNEKNPVSLICFQVQHLERQWIHPTYIYYSYQISCWGYGSPWKENGQVAKLLSFAAIKDLQCWHAVPHAQVSFLQKCFSLSISHTLHSIHSWPSCAISNILSFLDGAHWTLSDAFYSYSILWSFVLCSCMWLTLIRVTPELQCYLEEGPFMLLHLY